MKFQLAVTVLASVAVAPVASFNIKSMAKNLRLAFVPRVTSTSSTTSSQVNYAKDGQAEVVLVGCGAPNRGMGWYHAGMFRLRIFVYLPLGSTISRSTHASPIVFAWLLQFVSNDCCLFPLILSFNACWMV